MGAWIETKDIVGVPACSSVAPFMGAWIETIYHRRPAQGHASHPSWVRGLKLSRRRSSQDPLAGRTLHGCVD